MQADGTSPTERSQASARRVIATRLLPLFAVSGVAALVYQVCWQRMLSVVIGADSESVTIIVAAFMLGLGVGALLGGIAADRWRSSIVLQFALIELSIGGFALISPALIYGVAALTQTAPVALVALLTFLLLLVPTTLMGATLPLLVTHCMAAHRAVGTAIGGLYFANTVGAAIGAAVTGLVTFHYIGIEATIRSAAALNALVAALAILTLGRGRA
jgi:predicted MFS family arabinose efflux permease